MRAKAKQLEEEKKKAPAFDPNKAEYVQETRARRKMSTKADERADRVAAATKTAADIAKKAVGVEESGPTIKTAPSGRKYLWDGTEAGAIRMMEAEDRAAQYGKSADLFLANEYPDLIPGRAPVKEYGGNAEIVGDTTIGRRITEAGNQIYDLVTSAGVEAGKTLGPAMMPGGFLVPDDVKKQAGGFVGGQISGLAGGLLQVPTNVAGGALQVADPRSSTEERLKGGAEALLEVFGGAVVSKALKGGQKGVSALWKRAFGGTDEAADQIAARILAEQGDTLLSETQYGRPLSAGAREMEIPRMGGDIQIEGTPRSNKIVPKPRPDADPDNLFAVGEEKVPTREAQLGDLAKAWKQQFGTDHPNPGEGAMDHLMSQGATQEEAYKAIVDAGMGFRRRIDQKTGDLFGAADQDDLFSASAGRGDPPTVKPPDNIRQISKEPVTPDRLEGDVEHRNLRNRILSRYTKEPVDEIMRLDPDDARLNFDSESFDEDLFKATYRKITGKPYDDFSTNVNEAMTDVREALIKKQQDDWEKIVDTDAAKEDLDQLKGVLKTATDKEARTYWRAYRKRDGTLRVDRRTPAAMIHINDLPRPLRNRLVQIASDSGDEVLYLTDLDLQAMSRGERVTGRTTQEIATRELDLMDLEEGLGSKALIVPRKIVQAMADELGGFLKSQKELQRPLDEGKLKKEIPKYIPEDQTAELPDMPPTSARQADLQSDRLRMGQEPIEKGEKVTFEELVSKSHPEEAKYVVDGKTDRPWSAQETAHVVSRLQQLKNRHAEALRELSTAVGDDVDMLGKQIVSIEDEHSKLTEALHRAGTAQGRALAARKLTINEDFDLVSIKSRAKASKGKSLTEKEVRQFEALHKDLEAKEAQIAALERRSADAELLRRQTQYRRGPRRSMEAIKNDLAPAKAELSEAIKKALNSGMSSNLGSVFSNEDLYRALMKVAKLEIEAGVAQLDELVTKLKGHLSEGGLDEVSDSDVRRALAGMDSPDATPRTVPEARQRLNDLQREAKLIEEIDAAQKGVEAAKTPKAKRTKSQRVQELEAQLSEIQRGKSMARNAERTAQREATKRERVKAREERKRIEAEERELLKTRRPHDAKVKRDAEYREALEKEIGDLQESLRSGEYKVSQKKERSRSRELERLKAQRDLLKGEIKGRIESLRPKGLGEKVVGAWNLPKTLKSSIDISAPGRQGWILGITNPGKSVKAFGRQLRAMASPEAAVRYQNELLNRPNAAQYKESGLHLSPIDGGMNAGEEAFAKNFIGSTKWRRFNPFRGSERAYVTYLNQLRADVFDRMVKSLGDKPGADDLKAIANYVNVASGRGGASLDSLGFSKAAEALNVVGFSPRYATSRFEYALGQPMARWDKTSLKARGLIAGEYAKFLGGMAAVLGMAKGAGADVNMDPTSSDFGKIRIGNTRIDVGAGLLQPIVLMSRIAQSKYTTASGRAIDLDAPFDREFKEKGDPTGWDVVARFMRSKASPAAGVTINMIDRQDYLGKEYGWNRAFFDLIAPLSVQETVEGLVEDGFSKEDAMGLLNFLGFNTSTYSNEHGKVERRG